MALDLRDDRDDEEEDDSPYDSVSSRKPLTDVKPSPSEMVKQAILQKMGGKSPVPSDDVDDSSDDSDDDNDLSSDPLMQDFEKKQGNLEEYRKAKMGSDYINNLGSAFSQMAQGANAPRMNTELASNLQKQGEEGLKDQSDMLNRRSQVMSAIEQRKSREDVAADNRDARENIAKDNRESRALTAKMHSQDLSSRDQDRRSAKEEAQLDKMSIQMKDDLDPNKARGGNLASNQKRIDNADRIEALLSQVHNNPDPRQMEELAIASQALLSSSGTPAAEQVKSLIPHTAMGSVNAFKEWLTNDPTGTGQQEFVKRMADTVSREKQVAQGQVQKAQRSRLSVYGKLQKGRPDQYSAILNAYGLGEGEDAPKDKQQSDQTPPQKPNSRAGKMVKVRGQLYRVGADGDKLEEVM